MGRIGVYGGAFNPPHLGHVRMAQYALQTLRLDKLLLIPSCESPHKTPPRMTATARQRVDMLNLAIEGMQQMEISDCELRRGGISYTVDTLRELKKQYPEQELILLMGTDMLLSFDQWRCPDEILKMASLGVFYRGEKNERELLAQKKEQLEALGGTVHLLENPVTEISSTQLRRMLVFRCVGEYLPGNVEDYIRRENCYGAEDNYKNLPEEELEQAVVELLKPNRVRHVLGCRDTAAELAKRWGEDPVLAARAGLLHDITKALDGPLQLTLCREYGKILDDFSRKNPKTLHALTGSLVAQRVFGECEQVVQAIATHTTGKANMNTLQKIIYVADYMEPNRDFPGVDKLRHLAFTDLDGALKLGLEMTLEVLKAENREISPESAQALDFLNQHCP